MSDQEKPSELAQKFHEAYERLAPVYNYETRKESAVPWDQVPINNRRLMQAVCKEISAGLVNIEDVKPLLEALEKYKNIVSEYRSGGDEWAAKEALATFRTKFKDIL